MSMAEFTLTERTEPFTLKEVFDFIDDTHIGKMDAHELKSRIVDVVQDTRNKAIDEFVECLKEKYPLYNKSFGFEVNKMFHSEIDEIAEQMKKGE